MWPFFHHFGSWIRSQSHFEDLRTTIVTRENQRLWNQRGAKFEIWIWISLDLAWSCITMIHYASLCITLPCISTCFSSSSSRCSCCWICRPSKEVPKPQMNKTELLSKLECLLSMTLSACHDVFASYQTYQRKLMQIVVPHSTTFQAKNVKRCRDRCDRRGQHSSLHLCCIVLRAGRSDFSDLARGRIRLQSRDWQTPLEVCHPIHILNRS